MKIIQDAIEDWETEAANMRDVYANSVCNILADASTSPKQGLFRTRKPQQLLHLVDSQWTDGPRQTLNMMSWWDPYHDIEESPLGRRGWVLQERFLAPKVLHFAEHQIYWDCAQIEACEVYPRKYRPGAGCKDLSQFLAVQKTGITPNSLLERWGDVLTDYTLCGLSDPEDKLIALSGMAKFFHEVTGDEYVAGCWKSRMLESLLWMRRYEYEWRQTGDTEYKGPSRRPPGYRAPSWSFASFDGPMHPALNLEEERPVRSCQLAKILDVYAAPSTPGNPFGAVTDGFVTIFGSLLQYKPKLLSKDSSLNYVKDTKDSPSLIFDIVDDTGPKGSASTLLPLAYQLSATDSSFTKVCGLIVTLVAPEESTYRRIGYFDAPGEAAPGFFGIKMIGVQGVLFEDGVPLHTIKII